MKKYFIVADVHSFYDEMMTALNEKGWDSNNPDHIFVSLGDMFDRGPQSREVMDFLMSIPEDRRIFILGNHELLMEEMIARGGELYHDITNGTVQTAIDLTDAGYAEEACELMKTNQDWNEYIHSCQLYAEVGDNIFVHGWIPCEAVGEYTVIPVAYMFNWRNASVKDWKTATWINGMKAWVTGVKEYGKTIWCGHWHTSWGHSHLHHNGVEFPKEKGEKAHFSPFKDEGIVAMDACTAYSHKVNCEVIEMED
jgi:hypothetical protein